MSDAFDLESEWKTYVHLLSISAVADAIQNAVEIGRELPQWVIPSIVSFPDGPKLESIFVVTGSFLIEVMLDESSFDFIYRGRVRRIAWRLGAQDVVGLAGTTQTFETARVEVDHGPELASVLTYFGTERAAWMKLVAQALPPSVLVYR